MTYEDISLKVSEYRAECGLDSEDVHAPRVVVFDNIDEGARAVMEFTRASLEEHSRGAFVPAAGDTQVPVHRHADLISRQFQYRHIVGLDELHYTTQPEKKYYDATSFTRAVRAGLLEKILGLNIKDQHIVPNSFALDPEHENKLWGQRVAKLDIGVVHLGIGPIGSPHIGMIPKDASSEADTLLTEVDQVTRKTNGAALPNWDDYPTHSFTLAPATLMRASDVVLIAWGHSKSFNIANAVVGPFDPSIPSTWIQKCNTTVFLDEEAAAKTLQRLGLAT